MRLEVEALARGVGGHQDAQRVARRVGVEAALQLLAVGAGGLAVHRGDPFLGQLGAGERLLQHLAQVALGAHHVLGEDQHPAVVPTRPVGAQMFLDPADQLPRLGFRPAARGVGYPLHAVEQGLLPAPQPRRVQGPGRRRGALALGGRVDRRHLDLLGGLLLRLGQLGALVVGVRRGGEPLRSRGRERRPRLRLRPVRAAGGPLPLLAHRAAVPLERQRERLDRRQQPLLQPHHQQAGGGALARRKPLQAFFPHPAVLVQQPRQHQLRRVLRQPLDRHPAHLALREAALHGAQILLDAAHHHRIQFAPAAHRHAARKAVGIKQLQQGGEAVGVAVVRSGREEQAMLEAAAQIADGAGELGLDAVTPAARRRRVMRLVQDQQAARRHAAEPDA